MHLQRSRKQAITQSRAGGSDIVNMPPASARRGPTLHPDRRLGSMPCTVQRKKNMLATGLMIGVSEEEKKWVAELRKEMYKVELLKQIAENQRIKVREKTLDRRVNATGATDLQKEETHATPMKCPGLGTGAPGDEALLDHSSESYHSDFSQELGNIAVPRVAGLDPRVCPLCHTPLHSSHPYYGTPAYAPSPYYGTPASEPPPHNGTPSYAPPAYYGTPGYPPPAHNGTPAYAPPAHNGTPAYAPPAHNGTPAYAPPAHNGTPANAPPTQIWTEVHPLNPHYGTRNPLETTLPYSQEAPCRKTYQSGRPIDQRSSAAIEVSHQNKASLFQYEELAGNSRQQKGSQQSYYEDLRQQIKDNKKQKEMEKIKEERYDAKIEAERLAYTYWGRGGGGAPIRDIQGNLHSNLRKMHRLNEERRLVHFSGDTALQKKEREKYKEMEKREEERYDAKIEAERMADTWGGGGAPIRDKQGNLHSDLRRMRRLNEEQSLNPTSTRARAQVPFSHPPSALTGEPPSEQVDMMTRCQTQQIEEKCRKKAEEEEREMRQEEKLEKKIEKQSEALTGEPPSEQVHMLTQHQQELMQQIEEKRRKKAEEKEREMREDEKLEKKIEKQRAHDLKQFEEEQKRVKIRKQGK